jgi:hypothetical protein
MIKIPNGIFCNHQGRSSLNTGIDFSGTEELKYLLTIILVLAGAVLT